MMLITLTMFAVIVGLAMSQNMAGIQVAQGESIALAEILAGNLTLKLWTAGPNSNTPAKADIETDYTYATGSGYANKTLTGGIAVSPSAGFTLSGSDPTVATYNILQVFTFTGAIGPILGYSLHRASDGKLRYVEKFASPYSAVNNGDHLDLTVKVTQR